MNRIKEVPEASLGVDMREGVPGESGRALQEAVVVTFGF